MKNAYIFKYLLIVIAFLLNTLIFAQTTHTVILTCDTSNITKENVNEVCSFGQTSNVSNIDFTINVKLSDVVVWRGVTANQNSSIELHAVNYQGGTNLFNKNVLKDENGIIAGINGIIAGIISKGDPNDEEKYNLKFKVFKNGRQLPGIFKIDPKIRMQ